MFTGIAVEILETTTMYPSPSACSSATTMQSLVGEGAAAAVRTPHCRRGTSSQGQEQDLGARKSIRTTACHLWLADSSFYRADPHLLHVNAALGFHACQLRASSCSLRIMVSLPPPKHALRTSRPVYKWAWLGLAATPLPWNPLRFGTEKISTFPQW